MYVKQYIILKVIDRMKWSEIHFVFNYKRLEKKQTINSWKRHALCDAVLSYESSRWKFTV